MLSWWVGLSREDFWQECQTRQFSTRWGTIYTPTADMMETRYGKTADLHSRGLIALKHYRSAGFTVVTTGVALTESIKVTDQFEIIPYHERQAALENR